jgi:4,4'-diaponeurosporenoate glycosyltransferase
VLFVLSIVMFCFVRSDVLSVVSILFGLCIIIDFKSQEDKITIRFYIELITRAIFWLFGFWFLWKIPYCSKNSSGEIENQRCGDLLDKISTLKVSIIIPARNEEKTLSFLLSSIQSQTLIPHEVILVNDQSEDSTEAIGRQFNVKIINTESLPEGWLGKNWACYKGAENASGNLFLFLDADTTLEPGGLESLLACYLKYKGVVSVEPYHKIKKFYENFAAYFNIILMGSMNVFTPLQFRLKPIGAFGPCLLCSRETYFSIDGHSSTKDKIMEDLELGKILLSKGKYIYCFGGKGTISFRMYPYGIGSIVKGFSRGFAIGAKSTSVITFIMEILWIAGSFFPLTLLIQNIVSFNSTGILTGIIFYVAYIAQVLWMARRIGNFNPAVAIFFPVFLMFFITVFFWSILQNVFKLNIRWKGRIVNSKNSRTKGPKK